MEVVKDSAPDSDEENKLLRSLFDRMIQQPRNVKRRYIEELGKIVHPEWTNLKEPLVRQTKGGPKKMPRRGINLLGNMRKRSILENHARKGHHLDHCMVVDNQGQFQAMLENSHS